MIFATIFKTQGQMMSELKYRRGRLGCDAGEQPIPTTHTPNTITTIFRLFDSTSTNGQSNRPIDRLKPLVESLVCHWKTKKSEWTSNHWWMALVTDALEYEWQKLIRWGKKHTHEWLDIWNEFSVYILGMEISATPKRLRNVVMASSR